MSIKINSTGSCMPQLVLANDDLKKYVETSDEWIYTRTGIKSRHIATEDTCIELGYKAARSAMEASCLTVDDIDLVICATCTPESIVPGNAAEIRKMLGIKHAIAFDLNANCSGFVYSLVVAESLLCSLNLKNAIIIGSETLTRIADWTDRRTFVLFGDGAGAVTITRTSDRPFYSYIRGLSDVDGAMECYLNTYDTPVTAKKRDKIKTVQMNGRKIYSFAIKSIAESIDNVLKQANITIDDIKYIIPHQANARIIEATATRLDYAIDKFYVNIDHTGNTSAASIPIALDEINSNGLISKGDKLIFVGFGGGLTYGAVLLEW